MTHLNASPSELIERHVRGDRSLLEVLHAIQDEVGYLPAGVVAPLAQSLNLSRAEVHGVITYYHYFRTTPPPRVAIQLCRAESCRSMGSEAMAAYIEQSTGCRFDAHHHSTSSSLSSDTAAHGDEIGLESVYCLGLCGTSPAMTINGKMIAKLTPIKFDAAFDRACRHTGIASKETA